MMIIIPDGLAVESWVIGEEETREQEEGQHPIVRPPGLRHGAAWKFASGR
jgi:hypothetical protein